MRFPKNMNCLNFQTKKDFLQHISMSSKDDVLCQRKINSKLLSSLNAKYDDFRNHINSFIVEGNKIKNNNSHISFKSLLEETFNYVCSYFKVLDDFYHFNGSNFDDDCYNYNLDESMEKLDKIYDQTLELFNKFRQLVIFITNQTAIFAYKLFDIALLDEKELSEFKDSSFAIFGGKQDPKYTLNRFINQLSFNLDFVEGRV